jgi:RNA polymerase sigma factor (sigma-70 family)
LSETHIDAVKWVIYRHIGVNENIIGLGYDDLFQEGCAALCKAASTFDGSVKFITYAQVVVKNALISYCRGISRNKSHLCVSLNETEVYTDTDTSKTAEQLVAEADLIRLLASVRAEYSGTVRLGIEALELKIQGYSGAEIARMYSVKPNLVGAWISRASAKLRRDERFMRGVDDDDKRDAPR